MHMCLVEHGVQSTEYVIDEISYTRPDVCAIFQETLETHQSGGNSNVLYLFLAC